MAVKVLVVDDSGFFRRRISDILNAARNIEVVGTASNGAEAVDLVQKLQPDVITMDFEMPVMDGITAVREIMKVRPTPVIMCSSLTFDGARVTLDALEAGAVDFLPKNFEDISRDPGKVQKILAEKIRGVAGSKTSNTLQFRSTGDKKADMKAKREAIREALKSSHTSTSPAPATTPSVQATPQTAPRTEPVRETPPARKSSSSIRSSDIKLVAIGTSTGGPVALQQILTSLPANFSKPIVLVQHMPANFTAAFAERLNQICKITVKQAQDGDQLTPGVALLAPGGKQMMIDRRNGGTIRIIESDQRLNYKPCVDVTFGSAANVFQGGVLGIVLTGMGADGKDGSALLKKTGSSVWAQDQESCVIFGMPMAVINGGFADDVLSLNQIARKLVDEVS
ncbi:protein-glutamate methylesterase/protein-glutamine glutaminase [Litoribrevibacter albus]|uniref:Protein-glutamate methylesterase/protein-glutamine glutaminase n=1 Tax=Litoribrevibacter albus TaxID=1473156 RepID=A0AA37SD36_9GAMM|nr:chemotaxis response regulator protein-glutamate methylesterase [Litoribrevibacter albus]GLQ32359.1 chemotaxis response regulator protein-glutamate methylesterase 3 [Litoribrevibacter albus]